MTGHAVAAAILSLFLSEKGSGRFFPVCSPDGCRLGGPGSERQADEVGKGEGEWQLLKAVRGRQTQSSR